jgi:hypothetical protein
MVLGPSPWWAEAGDSDEVYAAPTPPSTRGVAEERQPARA